MQKNTNTKTTELGSVLVNGVKVTVSIYQELTQEVVLSADCRISEEDLFGLIDNIELRRLVDKAKITQYNAKIALGDLPE